MRLNEVSSRNETNTSNGAPRVLADSWYIEACGDLAIGFDEYSAQHFPSWFAAIARRLALLRGIFFYLSSLRFDVVVTSLSASGARVFLALEALLRKGPPRVVLLQFIREKIPRAVLKRVLYSVLEHWIHCGMKRSLQYIHVLTHWEVDVYSQRFSIPRDRFVYIPWYLRRDDDVLPDYDGREPMVISSGRTACDWDSLFKAAAGQSWKLTVICSPKDLARVQQLNRNDAAEVLCMIPKEEHNRLLRQAAVYVLSLRENERSSGHIRISNAIRCGTPLVVTNVRGVDGYLQDETTALLAPPADHLALRDKVDQLLRDPVLAAKLARSAFESAGNQTRRKYLDGIHALVSRALMERSC